MTNAVIPKVCSEDNWWSARLAEVVRESLKKSGNTTEGTQYFVLRGPPNYPKWSAHVKSLGTNGMIEIYITLPSNKNVATIIFTLGNAALEVPLSKKG